ncbi:glnD PII-uridylyltransferase family protein [Mycobacterium xenopi 3993]|nr:glnD PII-uridylyltransferase family protein [Mycobacterium xenopi 3993]
MLMADKIRYPPGGVSAETAREIRRIKARVDAERLPRGADPNRHTKLGRGGLADIEWTVQLLQMQHAHGVPALQTTSTLDALDAIAAAQLLVESDVELLRQAWLTATRLATHWSWCAASQPTSCPGRAGSSTPSRPRPGGAMVTVTSS